jgi:hypothetical protein
MFDFLFLFVLLSLEFLGLLLWSVEELVQKRVYLTVEYLAAYEREPALCHISLAYL